jgi:hypothetical protein
MACSPLTRGNGKLSSIGILFHALIINSKLFADTLRLMHCDHLSFPKKRAVVFHLLFGASDEIFAEKCCFLINYSQKAVLDFNAYLQSIHNGREQYSYERLDITFAILVGLFQIIAHFLWSQYSKHSGRVNHGNLNVVRSHLAFVTFSKSQQRHVNGII